MRGKSIGVLVMRWGCLRVRAGVEGIKGLYRVMLGVRVRTVWGEGGGVRGKGCLG